MGAETRLAAGSSELQTFFFEGIACFFMHEQLPPAPRAEASGELAGGNLGAY